MNRTNVPLQCVAQGPLKFFRLLPTITLTLLVLISLLHGSAQADEKFVYISAITDKAVYLPDESGQMTFMFSVAEAIKLNRLPPIHIDFSNNIDLEFSEKSLVSQKISEEELEKLIKEVGLTPDADIYFKNSPTMSATFHVPAGVPAGRRVMSAEISYFYCSITLGVCTRDKQLIHVPIVVQEKTTRR